MIPHDRHIAVIGLGYVGLPVAVAFAKFDKVVGFDISKDRIDGLKRGIDETREISKEEIQEADIEFTSNINDLRVSNFYIIAVPTPISSSREPDLTLLFSAAETLATVLKMEDIVVFESTVYPGATEEECIPILESVSGLIAGSDFYVGYSPERINPGDKEHNFTSIKKVVSAQQPKALDIIADVYGAVVSAGVYKASSIKVAEAAKVIENTQRDLNIALMNELAVIFEKMDIDTGDVLAAASTKWNFLPFRPGLVGGHCIGVDPYYLTFKASSIGYHPEVILAGRRINDSMGEFVAQLIIRELNETGKDISTAVVTILGITFKENIPDIRNSKVSDIVGRLKEEGIAVQVYDPVANQKEAKKIFDIDLVEKDRLSISDMVVLAVPHQHFVEQGWSLIQSLLPEDKGIVLDIHRILERSETPENIKLIRL